MCLRIILTYSLTEYNYINKRKTQKKTTSSIKAIQTMKVQQTESLVHFCCMKTDFDASKIPIVVHEYWY